MTTIALPLYRPTAWCHNPGCHAPVPADAATCPDCGQDMTPAWLTTLAQVCHRIASRRAVADAHRMAEGDLHPYGQPYTRPYDNGGL